MKAAKSSYELEVGVVNQLMAAQSILYVLPSELKLGEYVSQALKSVPAIDRCSICIRGEDQVIGDFSKEAEKIIEAMRKISDDQDHLSITLPVNENLMIFILQTSERTYGCLLLFVKTDSMFENLKSAVTNFINVVAVDLERRRQKAELETHRNNLEKQVEKRTADLQAEITVRKQAEEEIKKLNEELEQKVEARTKELNIALKEAEKTNDKIDGIVKSVADGLIVTDLRHRVILMNHAAEDLLGVRLSDVIGRSIDYAVEEKILREKIRYTLNKRITGYKFDFEWPGDDPKNLRIMRARTSVIHDKKGKDSGIVTIIHDVTHEREVDRMKTEFLSTAAHELRTPLTSIQGFSEILMTKEDLSGDEKKKFLHYINKQSISLAKIIRDLLDVSRIESRRGLAINKTKCDIKKIIEQVIPYFEEQSQIHTFKAKFPEKSVELHVDKEKIEQILKNLIGNSVKYSPKGGDIKIDVEIDGKHCKFSVKDQGLGMTSEQVEKVFDKFYRADASDTAPDGTGLGMTIVKYLVEAHNGKIWIKSKKGKGTEVTFTIPLKQNQATNSI